MFERTEIIIQAKMNVPRPKVMYLFFTRKDDYLPERFYIEPIKTGKFKGEKVNREEYDKMLDEYYENREWGPVEGVQTRRVLRKMDLLDALSKLEKHWVLYD